MEKQEKRGKKRAIHYLMAVHVMFTIFLLVGMAHIYVRIARIHTQMTQHIVKQEIESNDLQEMLDKFVRSSKKTNKEEHMETEKKHGKDFQHEFIKSKQRNGAEEEAKEQRENVDVQSLALRIKRSIQKKCCEKGSPGRKGDKGDKGDMGMTGRDGRDGRDGPQGIKGEKGETDKMYSTSAHFVGQGRARGATTRHCEGKSEQFFLFSWKKNHIRGSILYTNGELKVRQSGFYYIYAQIFYNDAIASLRGFKIFIDDCPVMQALNSPVSVSKKYATHYTGGAFRILSDQRISVGTAFNQTFGYNAGQSFFGTFFIHP